MAPWHLSPNRRPRCNDISALGMMTWQLSPNYRPMRFLHIIYRIQEMCYTDKSIVFPISFPCHIQSYLFPSDFSFEIIETVNAVCSWMRQR